jgi:hypothetical protein
MWRVQFQLVAWLLIISPCCFAAVEPVWAEDEKAVAAEAVRSIPYFEQFLALYPQATVRIAFPASVKYTPETEQDVMERFYISASVSLYARYVLAMSVWFKMSPDQKTVTKFSSPQFHMREVRSVTVTPVADVPGGQAHIEYTTVHAEFDYEKFKTLKARNGDFSVIGVAVVTDRPVANFEREWTSDETQRPK